MSLTYRFMITKCFFAALSMLSFLLETKAIASTTEEAIKLQQQGRYSDAISIYEKVLSEKPGDSVAAVNQAYCNERIGEFQRAAEGYSLAISHGKTADLLLSRGVCYISTEQYELAKADFESVIAMEDGDGVALLGLGVALGGLGDKPESEKLIRKAVDLDALCYNKLAGRLLCGGSNMVRAAIAKFIGELTGDHDHSEELARMSQQMTLALLHPGYRQGRRYIVPESSNDFFRNAQANLSKTIEAIEQDAEFLKQKKIDPTQLKADRLNGNWIVTSFTGAGTVIDLSNGEHHLTAEMNNRELTLIVDGERMINVFHQISAELPAMTIENAVWGKLSGKLAGIASVDGWCLHQRLEITPNTVVEIMAIKLGEKSDVAKKKHGDVAKDPNYNFQMILIRNVHTQRIDSMMQYLFALPAGYPELQGEWVLVSEQGKPSEPLKCEFVGRRMIRYIKVRGQKTLETMIYEIKLNQSRTPAEMDWTLAAINSDQKGIYSLQGDKLKVVLARSRQPRPKSLKGPLRKEIDNEMVFKRVRK
jgi:uncharacterized protein (TIGR03067 family)